MKLRRGHVTDEQAGTIGRKLGIKWDRFDVADFRRGLETELEHGSANPSTDITHDDGIKTGKIAYAHLRETPNYYTKLTECRL